MAQVLSCARHAHPIATAVVMMMAASVVRPVPLARSSDVSAPALVLDFTSLDDRVKGNAWLVPGVSGQALELDGIAAHVLVPSANVPRLSGSFTLEGWVALGAYPFNNAPILQQQRGAPPASFSASAIADRSASTRLSADGSSAPSAPRRSNSVSGRTSSAYSRKAAASRST